jgi:sugar phosphate isomerase/epimerase
MVDLELEGIPYWWDDGPRREESDRIRHDLLRAAEILGARHIKVTPDGDDAPWDREQWAAQFAQLAGQAENAGTKLGIEFFPWSNIKTLHDGLQFVEDAGHADAGVVIDAWHIERAHTPVADLASVPLHRIVGVELNDADSQVVGTLYEDTVHRRRYCGDGVFDLTGMIEALRTAGWVTVGRRGARPCCRKRPTGAGACWIGTSPRAMWLTAYRTRAAVAAAISPCRRRRPGPSR